MKGEDSLVRCANSHLLCNETWRLQLSIMQGCRCLCGKESAVECLLSLSLFHDAVTFLESLSGIFYEQKDVLNEFYQLQKVGVKAKEARHIASFQTALPYILGHIKDGIPNPTHYLLAVKSFTDWTSFDQDTGAMNYVLRGIQDLYIQFP